ncbi:class I SAM-dependent methyltransferase [Candidatus Dojkabacteria bacterium]|uniref:Class I SAM-dependent methyltransferase n=1 Tax=Candidatus Dojkabacteria bacterium TaxID=2099670 RepID=A0A955I9S2_9BACT|nr:class I SAM-dependent methyltransferase [Candidatus Dojkabacteria bacterium]
MSNFDNNRAEIVSSSIDWTGELGKRYGEFFNSQIPSDYPGYKLVEHFITPGSRVLEIGCSHGNFTQVLSQKVGEEGFVVGVDISFEALTNAKKNLADRNNVGFFQVSNAHSLSNLGKLGIQREFFLGNSTFDNATMTFVDPVLDTIQLSEVLDSAYEALKPGGKLIMFRLNPDAIMSKSARYRYYGDREPVNPGSRELNDGDRFRNVLRSRNGEEITLQDFFYTTNYMRNALFRAGFDGFSVYSLTMSLNNGLGETLRNSIEEIKNQIPGLEFIDEWGEQSGNSLYQIIVATKPLKSLEA